MMDVQHYMHAGRARMANEEMKEKIRPTIVCLCGSTRFLDAFRKANSEETLAGRIVLSIGCDIRTDTEIFGGLTKEEVTDVKQQLDELHKRKIELADEVLILNVGGYVGESTYNELVHARALSKRIRWLEPPSEEGMVETR